jgi:hypothetical protein
MWKQSGCLIGVGMLLLSATAMGEDVKLNRVTSEDVADRVEIENLRRLYAKATDAIGRATPSAIAEGRAIYDRIFTPDVSIRTVGESPLTAKNPAAWVDVVLKALRGYQGTQHLIGTQLVEFEGAEAVMQSYVNAWHQSEDGATFVFIGTYYDKVRQTEKGWQIYDMVLTQEAGGMLQIDAR